ncbi:MAG: hypothetical protein AAF432_16705 [Planctomycetota bacterium]
MGYSDSVRLFPIEHEVLVRLIRRYAGGVSAFHERLTEAVVTQRSISTVGAFTEFTLGSSWPDALMFCAEHLGVHVNCSGAPNGGIGFILILGVDGAGTLESFTAVDTMPDLAGIRLSECQFTFS